MQVAMPLLTVVFEPALQEIAFPLSKNETVPPFTVLVLLTVALIVAGLEGFGGVRDTAVLAGDTAVVVAAAAAPEVVTVILQPPLNE